MYILKVAMSNVSNYWRPGVMGRDGPNCPCEQLREPKVESAHVGGRDSQVKARFRGREVALLVTLDMQKKKCIDLRQLFTVDIRSRERKLPINSWGLTPLPPEE